MPELTLEFEVFCEKCGAAMCQNCTEGKTTRRGMSFISVEPCKNCLDDARDEGYEQRREEEE